jgi:hypothetical protein
MISSRHALAAALAGVAIIVALSSCGAGSYSRGFNNASSGFGRPARNAEGPWKGTWKSHVNGHSGPLWCIVQPTPDRPGHYDFRYRAGWGILRFGDYTHTTPARLAADGSLRLSGAMKLPGGFGTYQVDGILTREAFDATYRSSADHGIMTLRRPEADER